jgi:SAM-dependent methyltransferase
MNKRGRFDGVLQIVRYNARFYATAPIICAALGTIVGMKRCPRALRVLSASGGVLTAWWTVASLLVSYWVYDRSPLYRWQWLHEVLPEAPERWLNLHCGLDESSAALRELFPQAEGTTLDFFDATIMSEPSIRIARELQAAKQCEPALPADLRALPCSNACFDTVFLFFSAHEIRDADWRLQFFREVSRVLCSGGRVLLVEHPRDAANFLGFGPGFFHFWPRREWRRLAEESGLRIGDELAITPFVRAWILEKQSTEQS